MDTETAFFILGPLLAVSAVVVSFVGLRSTGFPGRSATTVVAVFAILVGATTTFAVLHAKDEEKAKASEVERAGEEFTEEEKSPVEAGKGEAHGPAKPEATAKGSGGTLKLAASPTQLAFDKATLAGDSGKVTIDFDNPSALEHNVAIQLNGKQIAISETIGKGKTSVSADLAPDTYTFLCTVPGHAEAGMEGTLTVK
jgi:plastocyanin